MSNSANPAPTFAPESSLAAQYAPTARNKWEAMLQGYQVMPNSELFTSQPVQLDMPLAQIISRAGKKAVCEICAEEIINGRELVNDGVILCRTCAGQGYYHFSVLLPVSRGEFSRVA